MENSIEKSNGLQQRNQNGLQPAEKFLIGKELLGKAKDVWCETIRVNKEIKQLEVIQNVTLSRMAKQFEQNKLIITSVFGERSIALNQHYSVLEKAMRDNDRELIIESLRGIGNIVSTNPLESLIEFNRVMDDKDAVLELDF